MEKSQHRHDISDKAWAILEPMLPGQRGQWGGIAEETADLSTECSGFFAPERHGVICRRTTGSGDPFISGFADGGIKAYGRRFSKH